MLELAMPLLNRSYWLEHATTDYPPLTRDLDVEVAVIGAGITGLTAAHLLKQAGKTVALVEMNRIGYGATGYTTAKLAVGHSLIYAALTESYGVETASRYARSNQEAIEQVARIVSELSIDCDFEWASNDVYTESTGVGGTHRARGRRGTRGGRRRRADDRLRLAVPDRRGRQGRRASPVPPVEDLAALARAVTATEATFSNRPGDGCSPPEAHASSRPLGDTSGRVM